MYFYEHTSHGVHCMCSRIETLESLVQQWTQETPKSLKESTSVIVPFNCESTEMDGKVNTETEQIPTDINGEIKQSNAPVICYHCSPTFGEGRGL